MEKNKFECNQPVSVIGNKAFDFKNESLVGHVIEVYSPSQKRKLNADYLVIFRSGNTYDLNERDLKQA